MNPKLKTAIIEFLANEFKLDSQSLGEDFNFRLDLDLTPTELIDLLQRLEEALDFSIPDEKIAQISTIEDLFLVLGLDTETDHVQ